MTHGILHMEDFWFHVVLSLQTIVAYLHFHLGRLDKLQGKVMTHSEKLEWWIYFDVGLCHSFLTLLANTRLFASI